MMKIITLNFIAPLAGMVIGPGAFGQSGTKTYENKDYKVVYSITEGKLNGNYVSYYKSGIKKAEGNYAFNNRQGDWKVYDSTGKLKVERIYTNSYEFKSIIPVHYSTRLYTLKRNESGFYSYFTLEQSIVVSQKRIWQDLFTEENPLLNGMFKIFYTYLSKNELKAYKPKPADEFMVFADVIDFDKTPLDTAGINIIGYKIYGDWFFDSVRNLSEYRVIGLCPLATRKQYASNNPKLEQYLSANFKNWSKDTFDLFWVYLPAIRAHLAEEKAISPVLPPNVQNTDDVFFWHFYIGHALSTQGGYENRPPGLYKKGSDIYGIPEIEAEHDILLKAKASH